MGVTMAGWLGGVPLPVGVDSFTEICEGGYCFVDKSMFMQDLLENPGLVKVFTRPPKFGKTLNLDMARVFFERTPEDNTSKYFKNMKIWKRGGLYIMNQGMHPVIWLSMEQAPCRTWLEAYEGIVRTLQDECRRQMEIAAQDKWKAEDIDWIHEFMEGTPDEADARGYLGRLCEIMHRHVGDKTVVLIDGYDSPLLNAAEHGFYGRMADFMREFLGRGIGRAEHVFFGCLTGVVPIGVDDALSSAGGLVMHTVLDRTSQDRFGFTPEETRLLFTPYSYAEKLYDDLESWYGAYRFGDQVVYNPLSVLAYFAKGCRQGQYWTTPKSEGELAKTLDRADAPALRKLSAAVGSEPMRCPILRSFTAGDILSGGSDAVCSQLLSWGYLALASNAKKGKNQELAIPNVEVRIGMEEGIITTVMPGDPNPMLAVLMASALQEMHPADEQSLLAEIVGKSTPFLEERDPQSVERWLLGLLAYMPKHRVQVKRVGGRLYVRLVTSVMGLPGVLLRLERGKEGWSEDQCEKAGEAGMRKMQELTDAGRLFVDEGVHLYLAFSVCYWDEGASIICEHWTL